MENEHPCDKWLEDAMTNKEKELQHSKNYWKQYFKDNQGMIRLRSIFDIDLNVQ